MKNRWLLSFVAILVIALGAIGLWRWQKSSGPNRRSVHSDVPDYSGITVDRVLVTELDVGKGPAVESGSKVSVRYGEWVYDPAALANRGRALSASFEQPFEFIVGQGRVIKGWEKGMLGMKPGGVRDIVIPIAEAYGESGVDSRVPKHSIILVHVELLNEKNQNPEPRKTPARKRK